ncbi:EcsC family protein [Fictibacillus phosphorivorans]|uniref:EcsC family protein n=1 Tax=Fictibacillus phosphorivorans TaxID=1221500 RepID=UPI0020414D92|nr:EcsC family protein [Fictibacillus phosphorivorans]MCM3717939.1 EcsC family protein [Fictibacillus phosphorivorans]MCM3775388.1 EcsC family protein [Fictibacillus phosphorivorans]
MPLTEREEQLWQEIKSWEEHYFTYEPTDFGRTYEKWAQRQMDLLPEEMQETIGEYVDSVLFHIHALIQNSQFQLDMKQRLLSEARVFRDDIFEIEDLKKCSIDQLSYMAEQQIARNRILSFSQGGLAGTGGLLFLGTDFPAMVVLGIRSVQSIAMHYGYDIQRPSEMMRSLKVYHAATMPKRYQLEKWDELMEELREEEDPIFYSGKDVIADISWMSHPIQQIVKMMAILLLRKKLTQGLPIFGMALGAIMNYQQSRKITEIAHKFYQKRYLNEKYYG